MNGLCVDGEEALSTQKTIYRDILEYVRASGMIDLYIMHGVQGIWLGRPEPTGISVYGRCLAYGGKQIKAVPQCHLARQGTAKVSYYHRQKGGPSEEFKRDTMD